MGLFDQLASQAIDALGGQRHAPEAHAGLLTAVMALINGAGGLPGLLQKFQDSGLGDQVASWIGHGANATLSGEQVNQALGADTVGSIAQQAGMAPEQAASGLGQLLPQIIDKLSPHGSVPDNDLLQQGLNLLKGKLFG